jgi:hypothetical protein
LIKEVLKSLPRKFGKLYSAIGREPIPPERLMRDLLLQGIEHTVWDTTSFTKKRDRLRAARGGVVPGQVQRVAVEPSLLG